MEVGRPQFDQQQSHRDRAQHICRAGIAQDAQSTRQSNHKIGRLRFQWTLIHQFTVSHYHHWFLLQPNYNESIKYSFCVCLISSPVIWAISGSRSSNGTPSAPCDHWKHCKYDDDIVSVISQPAQIADLSLAQWLMIFHSHLTHDLLYNILNQEGWHVFNPD